MTIVELFCCSLHLAEIPPYTHTHTHSLRLGTGAEGYLFFPNLTHEHRVEIKTCLFGKINISFAIICAVLTTVQGDGNFRD